MLETRTCPRYTVAEPFSCSGVGLHTGERTRVTVRPAETGTGITFMRSDDRGGSPIPASLESVTESGRRTVLQRRRTTVSTVEHLLGALVGCGIDDAVIEVAGREVPIMDGSALPFVNALERVGRSGQDGGRTVLVAEDRLTVEFREAIYELFPSDEAVLTVTISFDHPLIGDQSISTPLTPERFVRDLAGARTFGFLDEVNELRSRRLIRGASVQSVLVLSASGLWAGQELRWVDEFARHKALDVLGDLALLGATVQGEIRCSRPSHAGNIEFAKAIEAAAKAREGAVSYRK